MLLFVGTPLPNAWIHWSWDPNSLVGLRKALRAEKTHFMAIVLLAAGVYLGMSVLVDSLAKDTSTEIFLALQIPRLMVYVYIFWLAEARAKERGYSVVWLAWILGIVGRVNDLEVIVIPAVIVASLVLSEMAKVPEPEFPGASPLDEPDGWT